MNKKYLVVYITPYGNIRNDVVEWNKITEDNICKFECHHFENDIVRIINIIPIENE